MTKSIFIRKNDRAIKLLSFYYDAVLIDSVEEKFIALSSTISRLPKPLRKYRIPNHESESTSTDVYA